MSASPPRCNTCPFWHRMHWAVDDRRAVPGQCRIRSTTPFASPDRSKIHKFPPRLSDDWCGEHPGFNEYAAELGDEDFAIERDRAATSGGMA